MGKEFEEIMDFVKVLIQKLETYDIGMPIMLGALDVAETVAVELTGGQVLQGYMDGSQDTTLNLELNIKTKKDMRAISTLNKLAYELRQIDELKSENGSFTFQGFYIEGHPQKQAIDVHNFSFYGLPVIARITTYNRR